MQTPDITLVTLGGAFEMRNVSPFCLKIEMLLKALDLPFVIDERPDPRKAPKGKLPYLEVGGKKLPDSELIVQYLDEITQGKVFAGISAKDRAYGVALTRLAEDHLYWLMVASRWLDDQWWPNIVEGFFHIAPAPVRPLVATLARRQVRQTYNLHGLGRHSLAEQRGFAQRDLQALEDAVDADGFLFSATPNVYDFTVASIMAGIYDNKPATWLTDLAGDYAQLHAYTERVQQHMGVWGRFT
jgi:glutathione S-transferase